MAITKKSLSIVLILSICLVFFVGCKKSNPEMITSIILSSISEEEYNDINDSCKPEGATFDDFKKLYVIVKITNSKRATERTIIIPDLNIINSFDRIRTVGGGSFEQNNIGIEDTAESMSNIIFDSRGLSEHEVRSIYSESEIFIGYKLKNNNLVERKVSIGKDLVIKK